MSVKSAGRTGAPPLPLGNGAAAEARHTRAALPRAGALPEGRGTEVIVVRHTKDALPRAGAYPRPMTERLRAGSPGPSLRRADAGTQARATAIPDSALCSERDQNDPGPGGGVTGATRERHGAPNTGDQDSAGTRGGDERKSPKPRLSPGLSARCEVERPSDQDGVRGNDQTSGLDIMSQVSVIRNRPVDMDTGATLQASLHNTSPLSKRRPLKTLT